MRKATSVLIESSDKIEIGDGWGGAVDCVQILDGGFEAVTLRFLDIDKLDEMIEALSKLAVAHRLRDCGRAMSESLADTGPELAGFDR